jgi:hypothetical protein
MNNKTKNIYQGLNPIYESLASSVNEESGKKGVSVDAIATIGNIMNNFFSILISSKMENAKTIRGFQEIKNKILGSNNMGSLRQYIVSVLESLKALDNTQKEAYNQNIKYMMDLFTSIEPMLSDPKIFNSAKSDTITKMLNNFEQDLKDREEQMKKTNPKLFGEVVKKGLIVKEEKRTGEETDVEDAEFRGRAFNKSKESLDAANSFVGMIDRDKYNPALKDNEDVKRYKKIADDLYKKAEDLQMLDRKGLRNIITPNGEIKRNDYVRQQDSLINEIIRQKKEYLRIRDGILKRAGGGGLDLTPPIPICPPGHVYDQSKQTCIKVGDSNDGGSTGPAPTPTPIKECEFPISLNKKCNQVGEIQNKLMTLLPSVKEYLSKKGGVDKVYGKGTSAVSNIVWGYLSGNTGQLLTSDLTKEMYDAIMALTPNDIDTTTQGAIKTTIGALKDSRKEEMSIYSKIQEREEIRSSSVLSFEDFYSIIEENYSFDKIDEETKPFGRPKGIPPDPNLKKNQGPIKIVDSCVKDSIAQGKVLPCVGNNVTPSPEEDEEKKKEEKKVPTRDEWTGLKYVQSGTYPVSFDESLLSAWAKEALITAASFAIPGSGYLAKAGSASLKSIGSRLAVQGAKAIGKKVGAKSTASWISKESMKWFAKYKTIPLIGRTGAGLIGGTLGASALDFISGRNSFIITVAEGYIERNNLLAMVGGLVDTIDGYVSDEDLACIASVLAVVKGAWTIDNSGKAVSAWGEIKRLYLAEEGEDISADIMSISSKVGDVEGFPTLKASNPLVFNDIPWGSALAEVKDFVGKLDSNESKLVTNLSKLPEDYIKAHEEGNYENVTPEELEAGTKSSEKSEGDVEDIEVEEK